MAGELLAPGRILRLRLATAPAAHPHGDSGEPGHWRPCLRADRVHPFPNGRSPLQPLQEPHRELREWEQ